MALEKLVRVPSLLGTYFSRLLKDRLDERASILNYPADASDDDSSRFAKAFAAGVTSIYIPTPEVLLKQTGRAYLLIKNVDVTYNVMIYGDGVAGYRQVGGAIRVRDDADYGFYFYGTGNGTTSGTRVIGGGMRGISMMGASSANTATFIKVKHCSSMEFSNVGMRQGGVAFYLQDFMESHIDRCYMHSFGSDTRNVIHIGDFVDASPWNVNNLRISNCTFGENSGYWLYISDNANADLIWLVDSKFEWDATPTNANSTDKSVVYLGRVERFYGDKNGFVYFYPSHNRYANVFEVGAAATYGVVLTDNTFWGCDNCYWANIKGGVVTAKGNVSNSPVLFSNSSNQSQNIGQDAIFIRSSTGNRPTSYWAKPSDNEFISAHFLTGATNANTFQADADALVNGTSLKAPANAEIRRAFVPKDMQLSGKAVKVTVRCKNPESSAGRVQLLLNGNAVTDSVTSQSSGLNYIEVPAGSGWSDYTWYLSSNQLASGGALIVRSANEVQFLFDGISISYARQVPVTLAWTPGTVAAGTVVNTTLTTGGRLAGHIRGVSGLTANGSFGGAVSSAYFRSSDNTLVLQLAAISGSATTTCTSVSFVLLLN